MNDLAILRALDRFETAEGDTALLEPVREQLETPWYERRPERPSMGVRIAMCRVQNAAALRREYVARGIARHAGAEA